VGVPGVGAARHDVLVTSLHRHAGMAWGRVTRVGAGWVVIVPVKQGPAAKSRLRGARPEIAHHHLARALVRDTLSAAARCPAVDAVVVVGADPGLPGIRVLADPGGGLNAALAHAAQRVPTGNVAALLGDLPALDPAELAEALCGAAAGRAFVADVAGSGTTLLAAPAGAPLSPRFGPGSAAAHVASGARALGGAWPTLRHDVDTAEDLAAAAALGLGPHTGALLFPARP
jgi:2-phospho-L-lactate/phosphoenolpyruvate guanylyltransferase